MFTRITKHLEQMPTPLKVFFYVAVLPLEVLIVAFAIQAAIRLYSYYRSV